MKRYYVFFKEAPEAVKVEFSDLVVRVMAFWFGYKQK